MKLNRFVIWMALVAMVGVQTSALAGPFIPGQVLTAAQLNSVVDSKTTNAAAAITGGTITGTTIDGSAIGSVTPAPGVFTTANTNNLSSLGYSEELSAAVGAAASSAGVAVKTSRGTLSVPSATLSGDRFGRYAFWGYGSSAGAYAASIDAVAYGNFNDNNFPSLFRFNLAVEGSSTPVVAATLNASGVLSAASVAATNQYTGTFSDGVVVDYVTGNGRISVGASDTITLYANGVANTALAQFSASGLTLLPSLGNGTLFASAVNPSSGIVATATNNSAPAGYVGEYTSSSVASTTISLATASSVSITSLSLAAGEWDVSGTCAFQTAGTTTVTGTVCGISTTVNLFGADGTYTRDTFATVTPGAVEWADKPTPVVQLKLSSPTTVYLVGQSTFGVSTQTAGGFIRARRPR
jgi:hypothetical protein